MREIGSEFWSRYEPIPIGNKNNEAHLLSGRTALRFILDDICKSRVVRKALLPSYCCESMILPFTHKGINVQFYHVDCNRLDYAYDYDADIVMLVDFFGYPIEKNSEIACREKQVGKIVIYDSTHKIDGNHEIEAYADYSFCSFRKWFYCNDAKVVKYCGEFDQDRKVARHEGYVRLRDEAAHEKETYIEGFSKDKNSFLHQFAEAERILNEDYIGYIGEPVAFDIEEIIVKRRNNAEYLISELKSIPQISLWRNELNQHDTPMFVPILVDSDVRDDLRRALIAESIYCPIHWPKSPYHNQYYEVYDTELSLVCDQRYGIADMERIVGVIQEFFNK